jgi:hypothetical protein
MDENLHGALHDMQRKMLHGLLDYASNPPQTQERKTMTLPNLTTFGLLQLIVQKGPREYDGNEIANGVFT